MERYARQVILPEIGEAGQKKIANAAVLMIGAGGLGCPALQYLAAAGVGRIGIVDFDTVEESNLHRQILYAMDQVGHNKAEAAKAKLEGLNPYIDVRAYPVKLTPSNAVELFKDYDVIVDGSDNFRTKYLVNDASLIARKTFVYGSVLGFKGQMSVFNHGPKAPCYRCLFPEAPKHHIPNCAEAGVLGAMAGIIGAMQAMEAIEVILGAGKFDPLYGKFLTFDARSMVQKVLSLPKDPSCPTCSKPKEEIAMQQEIQTVTASEVKVREDVTLLDVRERDEFVAGHIEGAINLPLSEIMQGARPKFPKNEEVVVYCLGGIRSMQAIEILAPEGFDHLENLEGGFKAWNGAT